MKVDNLCVYADSHGQNHMCITSIQILGVGGIKVLLYTAVF